MDFKIGDVVEVVMPKNHLHYSYNGLKFKITKISSGLCSGNVLVQPADPVRQVCKTVNWTLPEFLVKVKPEIVHPAKKKYLSPFSGQWV